MTETTSTAGGWRPRLSANAIAMLAAGWMTLLCNQRLWSLIHASPAESLAQGLLFKAVMGGVVFAMALALILPFSVKGAFKPWLALLLVIAASANVLTVDFGAVADRHAIASVFETDRREAGEMMSAWVLARIFALGVLPALLVFWTRIEWKPFWRELLSRWKPVLAVLAPFAIAILGFGQQAIPFARNHPEARYLTLPFSAVAGVLGYIQHSIEGNRPHVQIGLDARHAPDPDDVPRLLVLVVGESARAESFSLAGYPRDTNPELSKLPIAFFGDVASCGTNTATSLPCMFSDLGRADYDQKVANKRDNAIDLLARAGWKIEWIDNNASSKKVAARIGEEGVMNRRDLRWCLADGCQDGMLVEMVRERIGKVSADSVIVLHSLGSHGPAYYARYPSEFARFKPECRSTDLQSCSREAIVNTYDNTIAYTDHVLGQLIRMLQADARVDGALLYISDHGESTGEHGLYLHGAPYAIAPGQQTRVPMLMWASDLYARDTGIDMACLRAKGSGEYSHDNFFDTLLGFAGVESAAERPALDITRSCRR